MILRITTGLAPLILFLSGCDIVTIDAPIGAPVRVAEQVAMTGRWIDDDGEIVEIRHTKDRQLTAGWLQWNEDDQKFVAETMQLDVRRVGDVVFLFTKVEVGYLFVRVSEMSDSEMLMHSPDPDSFRKAVENGRLSGDIQTNKRNEDSFHVRLRSDSKLTASALAAAGHGDLFVEDGARRFRLLKSFKDDQ